MLIIKLIIPKELIDAVAHRVDEAVVFVNDEINYSWQNQFAEFDAEATDQQEVLQIGVCEALGDAASDFDDPVGVILTVLDRPQRVLWIHDDTKFCGVHAEGCLLAATGKRSDIVDLYRRTVKDVR